MIARRAEGAFSRRAMLAAAAALFILQGCAHQGLRVLPREENVPYAFPNIEGIDDSDYLGGQRDVVIDAKPAEVMAALLQIETYRHVLPKLLSFSPHPTSKEGHISADCEIGGSLGTAKFTARAERKGDRVRFWVDRTRSHEIDDAFGWFIVSPEGDKTKVSFRIWIDVGSGLTEMFFGSRIKELALDMPERLKRFVDAKKSRATEGTAANPGTPPATPSPQSPTPATHTPDTLSPSQSNDPG